MIEEKLSCYVKIKMKGLPLREVARETGLSHATISRVLNKKTPDLHTFIKLVKWLRVNPAIFMGITYDELETARYDLIAELLGRAPI